MMELLDMCLLDMCCLPCFGGSALVNENPLEPPYIRGGFVRLFFCLFTALPDYTYRPLDLLCLLAD